MLAQKLSGEAREAQHLYIFLETKWIIENIFGSFLCVCIIHCYFQCFYEIHCIFCIYEHIPKYICVEMLDLFFELFENMFLLFLVQIKG